MYTAHILLNTVFLQDLAMARFYFKALVGAATIQGWRLQRSTECGFDNQHCSQFVCMNIAHAHTYKAVKSLPCGEILRAVFICLKVRRHFEGGNNLRCGDILRKYGNWTTSLPCVCICRPKMQSALNSNTDQIDQKPSPSLLALQSPSRAIIGGSGRESKTHKKRKRIPYTLVEASKGNHCPTPGCDGVGHLTGMYAMHFAVSGCPKAHGKTPEECRARREELNRLRLKAIPPTVMATGSTSSSSETSEGLFNVGYSERTARRVSRVTGGNSPPTAPSNLQSHMVRRSSSRVSIK